MFRVRNLVFILLLMFLFIEVLLVFPSHVEKEPATEAPAEELASEEMEKPKTRPMEQNAAGVQMVVSQGSEKDWELFAEQAEGDQTQAWGLKGVRALFYNNDKVAFTVTGKEGSIDTKSRNMQIRGDVQTLSTNGYRFYTQDIKYDATKRMITSPTRVRMTAPPDKNGSGMKITGENMQADVDASRVEIFKDVSAEKQVNSKTLYLKADAVILSGKDRQAQFKGRVRIQYGDAKIEGPEASFLAAASSDILSKIQISGGVKVTDTDKFATSESLNLDLLANQFILNGQPKVYQGQDELAGERIIFLDGGKKVRVESVKLKSKEHP